MASADDTWRVLHSHLCALSLELHSAEQELSSPVLERLLQLVTRRGGAQELPRVAVVAVRQGREARSRVFGAPRALQQRIPTAWRQTPQQGVLALELPIQFSLRLQLPALQQLAGQLGRVLLQLASVALVTTGEAAVPPAPVAAAHSPSSSGVSVDRLVCASVDGFDASPPGIPMYLLEECIEHVEERVALDQLIINQTRMQHSQLAVRVARLEARQREVALEREARLAALDRENHLENRLTAVEALATSPWRTKSFASTHDEGWFTAASESTSPSEHGDSSLLDWPAAGADAAQPASSADSSAWRTAGGEGKGVAVWSESGSPGDTVGSSVGSASQSWVGRPAARIPAFMDSMPPTPEGTPDIRGGFEFPPSPQVRQLDASFLRRAQSTPVSAMSAV